jgi:hypothetical protein
MGSVFVFATHEICLMNDTKYIQDYCRFLRLWPPDQSVSHSHGLETCQALNQNSDQDTVGLLLFIYR